ncbi:MAG: hypothetical protein IH987_02780 [Planctomycetes bacterium]|nr:hypothetical protein [Planctomycetota bacterium]
MADNPPQDASLPDPDGTGGEVVSEEDLDALLVEASQLASEVSGEVGSAPPDAAPIQAETPPEGEPVDSDPPDFSSFSGDEIDAQLAALDRLVDETENEIGAPTEPDSAEAPADSPPAETLSEEAKDDVPSLEGAPDADDALSGETDDSSAPSEEDVPDFMQEFTQPAGDSPQDSDLQENPDPSERASKTAVDNAPSPATTRNEEAESSELAQSTGKVAKTDRAGWLQGLKSLITRLGHKLSPIALRVSEKAVTALELFNLPTQRIGAGIRTGLGWLAIATIATSVLVLLASLF